MLEAKLDGAAAGILTGLRADLAILSRRAKLINRAITLCTTTALLVCTVHCNIVPERLFTLRRLALRGAPLYRGNVDFLFCAGVVSAGDLFGHGEPTDRPALSQPG